jgi:hypothetical protein
VLACAETPEGHQPPQLVVPTTIALCAGSGLHRGFRNAQILVAVFRSGSLWLVVLLYLYRRLWSGVPFVPGRRKSYRGIAVLIGFLIFAGAWYIMINLDPSLLETIGLRWAWLGAIKPNFFSSLIAFCRLAPAMF